MRPISLKLGGITLALILGGCVVAPRPAYYGSYRQDHAMVMVAPPEPVVEVIGVPPYAGHIWIGGAWFWEGGRHQWHPGHWEAPRPGHYWVPHRWEHDGHYWHFKEGRWDRHHR